MAEVDQTLPTERVGAGAAAEPRTSPRDRFAEGWDLSFGFNLERIPGQGEDSDPVVMGGSDVGLVAVFDGMGGAGGTVYQTPDGPRTGAYLASRVARDVAERRMVELLNQLDPLDGAAAAADLQGLIHEALVARLVELGAPTSSLRSRLLRALPTTMALGVITRPASDSNGWRCDLLWAGDSRVYLLDSTGVHQLTRDDIREHGDAMTNLRADSVVSNAMSADTPFVINHAQVQAREPFLLLAATDGCFGYFRSPMHFEGVVLAALRDAHDMEGLSTAIQHEIAAVAGDDAAMAALVVGAELEVFRALMAPRLAEVEQRWLAPMNDLAGRVGALELQLRSLRSQEELQTAELWAAYKPAYERHLAGTAQGGQS